MLEESTNSVRLHATPKRVQESWVETQYFAPRGRERLLQLGERISQLHLSFTDRLIGIIGAAGSGKSSLIHGMFPGLELSNDDDAILTRKIMQFRSGFADLHSATTFHLDMRFQLAFTQMYEIVDFVNQALAARKRLVIEHFDLLTDALGRNADLLIAIGEQIIITRPSIFGPEPHTLSRMVESSLIYRKMAHSAEEVTTLALAELFNLHEDHFYSADIAKGYVLKFNEDPNLSREDLCRLEQRILDLIRADLPISYIDEDHIKVGERILPCEGPRIHVRSTGEIEDFSLHHSLIYDGRYDAWCLVGLLGATEEEKENLNNRNVRYFLGVS